MTQLISYLKGIAQMFLTAFEYVEQFIESLVRILGNIPGTLSFLTGAILSLPPFVTAFATLTLGITIAYFLVNRDPGGSS